MADDDWRTYALTAQDLTRAHRRFTLMSLRRPRAWAWLPIVVVIGLIYGLLEGAWWKGLVWAVLVLATLAGFWWFIGLPRLARRRIREQPAFQKPLAYAIRPDGFHYRTAISETRIDWDAIPGHWFGSDIVLIFPVKGMFYVFPPNAYSQEDRAATLGYLRTQPAGA